MVEKSDQRNLWTWAAEARVRAAPPLQEKISSTPKINDTPFQLLLELLQGGLIP